MKIAIVKSSELGTDCWSALRFTGMCHDCRRVEICELKEANLGRIVLYKQKGAKLKKLIKKF